MPNRILREGILTSERVCSLSWQAEILYRRLMSVVDDYGRYFGKPMALRAACYPLQLDAVRDADIEKWLAELVPAKLIRLYQINGAQFLEMSDFRQHMRAKKSKYPAPDGAQEVTATTAPHKGNGAHKIIEDSGDVIERIPMIGGEEFEVRQSLASELERLYPNVDIPATLKQMRGWCIGNPTKLKTPRGIRKFITGWCERDQNGS